LTDNARQNTDNAPADEQERADNASADEQERPQADPATDHNEVSDTKTHTERLEAELEAAHQQRDEYLDLLQRSQAEFENHKKRAQRDAQNTWARKKQELVAELLPVVDNLERGLAVATQDQGQLREGVELVLRELVSVLERNGVYSFSPEGEVFDPTAHEALSTIQKEDTDAGLVLEVIQKGYRLGDTIIRPARVVVSS
jgi:molecular chaperone GrpE